jgi:hypothetical protein
MAMYRYSHCGSMSEVAMHSASQQFQMAVLLYSVSSILTCWLSGGVTRSVTWGKRGGTFAMPLQECIHIFCLRFVDDATDGVAAVGHRAGTIQ